MLEHQDSPKKTIAWLNLTQRRYGGFIHGKRVRDVLSSKYDVEFRTLEYVSWRLLKPFGWFIGLLLTRDVKDLWVRDDLITVALPFGGKGKQLVIVRHIDSSVFPLVYRLAYAPLEWLFYRNLRKVDAIVTISEYWRRHFLDRGYSDVYKINGGFDVADFRIDEQEIAEWKKRFGVADKPIIYLGNCQKEKGVVEACHALKDVDAYLVTSGERRVTIPAVNINGTYREYLCLLKAASVVITMSKFKEGWCRTAHEAMLLKTPVIGSGKGGMRELLEGGGQIICENFDSLKVKVEDLLGSPEKREILGESGYEFAKNFTMEKFEKEWKHVIQTVVQ